jgi:hypothetical protein
MADNEENTVAEQTAQDKPMSEEPQIESDQTQEEVQEPVETETTVEPNDSPEVPKDNAAWAAMRVENKKLKQALEQSGADAEYLDRLKQATSLQPYVSRQPQQVTENDELPKVTGAINTTQQQVFQTHQELINLKNQIRESEDREAEMLYPDLKTDKAFNQLVSEKRLASEVLGKHRRTAEICAEVSKLLSRRDDQVKAQTRQDTEKQLLEKQRATAEIKSTSSDGRSTADDEEQRMKIRRGDMEATQDMVKKKLMTGMDF